MNEEPRRLIIEALRSDKYTQGKGRLKRRNAFNPEWVGHCCLGVVCELYKIHVDPSVEWQTDDLSFLGEKYTLPEKVAAWSGISDNEQDTMARWNDADYEGYTFEEIADKLSRGEELDWNE